MKAKVLLIWLIAYLLGCLLGYILPVYGEMYLVLGVILCSASLLVFRKTYIFAVIFALGVLAISVWNFQTRVGIFSAKNELASKNQILLQIRVDDLPQKALHGDKVRFVIVGGHDRLVGSKFNGYLASSMGIHYGDVFDAEIKLGKYKSETKWRMIDMGVIGESSVNRYTKIGVDRGFWVRFKWVLLSFRQGLNESISSLLPEREAGLASGIILGEKALVSAEMVQMLKVSGTTHIIALSGYNITVILGAILLFRHKLSRRSAFFIPVSLILIFTIMTGAAPSLVRAAIMGSMPLLARFLYRESDSFVSIIFSATLMAMVNPMLPLFDIGFQLSFVAIAGIIYIAPIVGRALSVLGDDIAGAFSETLGAQIATVPLLSYYFGLISVISPISNFIILGILPTCMALSFAMGLAGMVWHPLGVLLATPTYIILSFVNNVISWSGSLSWASTTIQIENPWWILICYLAIFDLWFVFRSRKLGPVGPAE